MNLPRTFLITGLCFGLGVGLAPITPVAHACKCLVEDSLALQLVSIEGDGEADVEASTWTDMARLDFSEDGTRIALDADANFIDLELVQ